MNFILKQIKFSERHADGEELLDILPNASLPWGLRTVDGSFNNLTPDQTGFGQADLEFLSIVEPEYPNAQTLTAPMADNDVPGAKTSYVRGDGRTVQDSTPRLISNLIVNQSTMNPAAVQAAADEDGTLLGPDIAGADQFLIPNTAPDEGLSAPFNLFMTFFGQFFDHGLDLVNKGGNGVVFMPLAQDDPLYDKGADGIAGTEDDGKTNFMMMTRASR
ncbi:MAG: heme peroxidase, partial [Myxococcota bacterium]